MFSSKIKGSLDSDALAFAAASGATDIRGLSYFARGIKNLGLWPSTVCWPLRSAQNAGTGTIAYSLGGLGAYNGTLVNGPTWGANGMSLASGSGQYISFPTMSGFAGGVYCGSVHSVPVVPAPARGISIETTSGQVGGMWAPFSDGAAYWDCLTTVGGRISATSGAVANVINMWAGSSVGTSLYRDTTLLVTGGTPTSMGSTFDRVQFGRSGITVTFTGAVTMIFIGTAGVTQSQHNSFFSLYKSTLGAGLGLP